MKPEIHDLKIWPEFFDDVRLNLKTFEVRKNDRNFQTLDVLLLREWDPATGQYTGRMTEKVVVYIMRAYHDKLAALTPDFLILGIRDKSDAFLVQPTPLSREVVAELERRRAEIRHDLGLLERCELPDWIHPKKAETTKGTFERIRRWFTNE